VQFLVLVGGERCACGRVPELRQIEGVPTFRRCGGGDVVQVRLQEERQARIVEVGTFENGIHT